MNQYVCGFLFGDRGRVALIRKAKPSWQKDRLNGIGGKIEPEETMWQAMSREFKEETDYFTTEAQWTLKLHLCGRDWKVYFLAAKIDQTVDLKSDGEEPCGWYDISNLPPETMPNLRWIIPLCLDQDILTPVVIWDKSDPSKNGAAIRETVGYQLKQSQLFE